VTGQECQKTVENINEIEKMNRIVQNHQILDIYNMCFIIDIKFRTRYIVKKRKRQNMYQLITIESIERQSFYVIPL